MSRKKFTGAGRGAIVLMAGLLLTSGAIRLGIGAGQAVATESSLMSLSNDTAPSPTLLNATTDPEYLSPLLAALQEREARVEEQEEQIAVRLKALEVADQQIERRLERLQAAEESLRATLAIADTAAEDDLTRLTTVYESMKPKDAASLFEEMEPAFAAGFLGRMRPDAAAGIMAGLSPASAYSISVILAGRNASVPQN